MDSKTLTILSIAARSGRIAYVFFEGAELKAWVPDKPKLWESEPRNLIYFEALALLQQALESDAN